MAVVLKCIGDTLVLHGKINLLSHSKAKLRAKTKWGKIPCVQGPLQAYTKLGNFKCLRKTVNSHVQLLMKTTTLIAWNFQKLPAFIIEDQTVKLSFEMILSNIGRKINKSEEVGAIYDGRRSEPKIAIQSITCSARMHITWESKERANIGAL